MKTARDSCEVVVNTGRVASPARPVATSRACRSRRLGWPAARTLRRLAILANVVSPIGVLETREVQATARKLGLEAATSEIRQAEDTADDVRILGIRRGWRSNVVWSKLPGPVSAAPPPLATRFCAGARPDFANGKSRSRTPGSRAHIPGSNRSDRAVESTRSRIITMRRPAGNDPRFWRQPCSIRATPNWGLLPVVDAAIWRQSAERLQILDWVRYGRAPSGTNLIGGGPVAFAILFQPLLAGQHRRKPLGSVRNGRPGINDLPHWGSAAGHREKAMEMQRLLFQIGLVCLLITPMPVGFSAHAQDYPAGPVKFITQLAAGGGTDPAMRIVIDHLGRMWGQQTTLINQPGAGGAIAARAASAATPDGYTLYMAIASTFISLPEIQPNLPFNVNDFVPIGFVGEVPMAVAVSPTLPVNSLAELIAYSRTQPGGLSVAIPNRGGIPHLATELFRERAGAELTYVFYPGSAQAMSDVISGRVQMIIEGLAGPLAGGQVKLLAVASPTRLASRPDLATVSETVPGFAASGWFVLVAPSGTPSSIVQKVSVDLREVLARPDVKQKFDELSLSTRPMSSQELGDFIRSERQLWKPVIKQIGLAMQ